MRFPSAMLLMSFGWGYWIRTSAYRSQSPVPYRLAKPQYIQGILLTIVLPIGRFSKFDGSKSGT